MMGSFFPCPRCGSPVEWTQKLPSGHFLVNDVKVQPCGCIVTEQEIVTGQIQAADVQRHHMPERANREGDTQPMPQVNDHPDIQSQVIADIEARREVGIKRYGTALQPHNGRDALVDAYEEVLDLACYLKQRIVEDESERMAWLVAYTEALEDMIKDMSPIHHQRLIDLAVVRANKGTGE